jgi:hypothetical protein
MFVHLLLLTCTVACFVCGLARRVGAHRVAALGQVRVRVRVRAEGACAHSAWLMADMLSVLQAVTSAARAASSAPPYMKRRQRGVKCCVRAFVRTVCGLVLLVDVSCLPYSAAPLTPRSTPRFVQMAAVKAHEMRDLSKGDLEKKLKELKIEVCVCVCVCVFAIPSLSLTPRTSLPPSPPLHPLLLLVIRVRSCAPLALAASCSVVVRSRRC